MTAVHIEHTGTFGRQRKWVLVTSGRKVVAYNIGLPQQEIQIDNGKFVRVVGKVQPFTHYVRIGHWTNLPYARDKDLPSRLRRVIPEASTRCGPTFRYVGVTVHWENDDKGQLHVASLIQFNVCLLTTRFILSTLGYLNVFYSKCLLL